jgi:uncharacterized caspase-like protein
MRGTSNEERALPFVVESWEISPAAVAINGAVHEDVQQQALPLQRPVPTVLILAASRDNPFLPSMRSHLQGLSSPNVFIAYATAPGTRVLEGAGRNSIYTKHLLRHITTPGLSLVQLFRHVRRAVIEESEGKQTPWESFSLPENFSLVKQPE